jgi:dienelactone hydrolase
MRPAVFKERHRAIENQAVNIGPLGLEGTLSSPRQARGLIIFAHGSGSSRHSPRNIYVAQQLQRAGFATLLFDLLTELESADRTFVFDIPLLSSRVVRALKWAQEEEGARHLRLGLFGASTGGAAAIVAAARKPESVAAVVSRGGRPDLAATSLPKVKAPTLLIVGGEDEPVLSLNRNAFAELTCVKQLDVVPGATHLFEEPGALDRVVESAATWFGRHLGGQSHASKSAF